MELVATALGLLANDAVVLFVVLETFRVAVTGSLTFFAEDTVEDPSDVVDVGGVVGAAALETAAPVTTPAAAAPTTVDFEGAGAGVAGAAVGAGFDTGAGAGVVGFDLKKEDPPPPPPVEVLLTVRELPPLLRDEVEPLESTSEEIPAIIKKLKTTWRDLFIAVPFRGMDKYGFYRTLRSYFHIKGEQRDCHKDKRQRPFRALDVRHKTIRPATKETISF